MPASTPSGDPDAFEVIEGFDLSGSALVEPAPDEDAWEAYIEFALDRIGDDRGPGLTNRRLSELESLIGHQLPFEIGMLLVIGAPETMPWHQWHDDPEAIWASWTSRVRDGLLAEVDEGFWSTEWGPRPNDGGDRRDVALARLADAAPLFPLWADRCVPLGVAEGHDSADGNPILSLRGATVTVVGVDLAAALHAEFGVPLPMWPPDPGRRFPFWSALSP